MLGLCFRLTRRLPFVRLISRRLQFCQKQALSAFERLKDVSFRGSLMSLVTVMIVWVAIFLYIAFYYAYMPSISHSRSIHLEFNSCHSSEVCSYPTAVVKLTRRQQLLMVGQPYKIVIHLDMPESPANRELGMFMVCGELKNYEKCSSASSWKSSGCECSKSCRATMLHYRSPLLQALITLALSPFMIFGNIEEKQTIAVELYSEFEDDQNCPVTDIEVQILSQRVELYAAKLGIHAHLTGLRYLMYHWPITSALIGVSCNLFFIFFIVSLSWWRLSQSDNFKADHPYNFSVTLYRTKEKSDYEEEVVHEGDIEVTAMLHESVTPRGTPKLKRLSKASTSVASDPCDDIQMDVLDDEPFDKTFSKESTS